MNTWLFREYISPTGRRPLLDWYRSLSKQAQADFDELIRILEKTREWREPAFKRLQGKKYKGLGELRWKTVGVQYRVIGMNGPRSGEYTLFIGCTHKGSVYKPPDALETAVKRMRSLQEGKGSTCEHEI